MMVCLINSGCVNYYNKENSRKKANHQIQCPIAEEIEKAYREQEKNR